MLKSKNIAALTGIRGIAALWVFSYHYRQFINFIYGIEVPVDEFFAHGYWGVDIFFILSGFIMTHVHYEDFKSGISINKFRSFLTLRAMRIYPLHLFCLLSLLTLITLIPELKNILSENHANTAFTKEGFWQSVFLIQGWGIDWQGFSWNGPSWTLSAEWLDYLAFPFLIYVIRWIKSPIANFIIGIVVLLVMGLILQSHGLVMINATHFGGVFRAIGGFTGGCFLNRFYQTYKHEVRSVGIIFMAVIWTIIITKLPEAVGAIYVLFGILILSLAYSSGFYERVFGGFISVWLGRVSFSFYLTHSIILGLIEWVYKAYSLNAYCNVIVVFTPLLCLLAANVCYGLIEKPSQKIGHLLASKA